MPQFDVNTAIKANAEATKLVLRAMSSGDVSALEQARVLGWNPSLAPPNSMPSWFPSALREKSGKVVAWLLEHFPIDSLQAFSRIGHAAGQELAKSAPGWSPLAMERAEAFAISCSSVAHWIAMCGSSVEAAAYFKSTLTVNPLWSVDPEPSKASAENLWAQVRPFVELLKQTSDLGIIDACVPHILKRAQVLSMQGATAQIQNDIAYMAQARFNSGLPLAPTDKLLDVLPKEMCTMGGKGLELGAAISEVNTRGIIEGVKTFLSGPLPKNGPLPTGDVPVWELGAHALMGRSAINFEYALKRGWIAPFSASGFYKCENPYFIGWHQFQVAEKMGRPVDMEARWDKCKESLQQSDLGTRLRVELINQCTLRSSSKWSLGDKKVIVIGHKIASSPFSLVLANPWPNSETSAVRFKVEGLIRAGFSLVQATNESDPLSGLVLKRVHENAWLASLLEKEELGQVAKTAISAKRTHSL